MSDVLIKLNIAQPILLKLAVDNGFCIIPDQVPAAEPLFLASEAFKFENGDKGRLEDALVVSGRLAEFSTEQARFEARENLNLNDIDCGTFN